MALVVSSHGTSTMPTQLYMHVCLWRQTSLFDCMSIDHPRCFVVPVQLPQAEVPRRHRLFGGLQRMNAAQAGALQLCVGIGGIEKRRRPQKHKINGPQKENHISKRLYCTHTHYLQYHIYIILLLKCVWCNSHAAGSSRQGDERVHWFMEGFEGADIVSGRGCAIIWNMSGRLYCFSEQEKQIESMIGSH